MSSYGGQGGASGKWVGGGGVGGGGNGAPGGNGESGCCCFAATSLVDLSDGSQIPMKDVKVGQGLMTLDSSGSFKETTFLGWLHQDTKQEATFLLITTSDGYQITLTPDQIIWAGSDMRFAHQVKIGDLLYARDGSHSPVSAIHEIMSTGIFSPLTKDSTILVNGILASGGWGGGNGGDPGKGGKGGGDAGKDAEDALAKVAGFSFGGGKGGKGGLPGQPGQPGEPGCFCFLGTNLIDTSDGQTIFLKDLTVGQAVMTLDSQGNLIPTDFLGWLHRDTRQTTNFLKITTSYGKCISLTHEHIIMVGSCMKLATHVKVGDLLHSKEGSLCPVTSISEITNSGIFSPLTITSTILVNGLLASCFASTNSIMIDPDMVDIYHNQAHSSFSLVRGIPWILENEQSQVKDGVRRFPMFLKGMADIMTGSFSWEIKKGVNKTIRVI